MLPGNIYLMRQTLQPLPPCLNSLTRSPQLRGAAKQQSWQSRRAQAATRVVGVCMWGKGVSTKLL